MRAWTTFAAVLVLGLPAAGQAQEAFTYLYDAQGRLIAAARASNSWAGTTVGYKSDAADNRIERQQINVAARAAQNELRSGELLVPQQPLVSLDGRFQLLLQTDGNLVLYFGGSPLWGSATNTGRSMVLAMQGDGNLVLYDPAFAPLWATNTFTAGAKLVLRNDGVAEVVDGSTQLWATPTCCH